jgi:2-polyprenyl-3-methyl-5-hydroxy-6-metoxy-1,4-benzoquinol methylase
MSDNLEYVNCPYCNVTDGQVWAKENGFSAIKCDNCNFIYVNPRPKRSLIKQSVEEGMHSYLSDPRSKVTRRIKTKINIYERKFSNLLPDVWQKKMPVSWLDVGAGFGEIIQAVSALAPANSSIEGIEPMKPKVALARKLNLNVKEGYLEQVDKTFNFISFINVFSHLDNIDDFLKECNNHLADSGELIIETGNMADLKSASNAPGELDLPDHLMFAGEKHIIGFLERNNFEVLNSISYRRDTPLNFIKDVIKKLMGRSVNLSIPYTSEYRTIIYRAKKLP